MLEIMQQNFLLLDMAMFWVERIFYSIFINNPNIPYIPITDKRMTRFILSIKDGVDLVWKAFEDMCGW